MGWIFLTVVRVDRVLGCSLLLALREAPQRSST